MEKWTLKRRKSNRQVIEFHNEAKLLRLFRQTADTETQKEINMSIFSVLQKFCAHTLIGTSHFSAATN